MLSPSHRASLRAVAMLLALASGVWHIADLWFEGLDRGTLAAAARGGVLLLLALGLMGTQRLALALVVVFCGLSLAELISADTTLRTVFWLEGALVVISLLLLCYPPVVEND